MYPTAHYFLHHVLEIDVKSPLVLTLTSYSYCMSILVVIVYTVYEYTSIWWCLVACGVLLYTSSALSIIHLRFFLLMW